MDPGKTARERKTVVRVVFMVYVLTNYKAINGFSIFKIPLDRHKMAIYRISFYILLVKSII